MECLKPRLQGGGGDQIPNVSMIYTLGHLSSVTEFMPHIAPTLDVIITMLPQVKSDEYKCAFSYGKIFFLLLFSRGLLEGTVTARVLLSQKQREKEDRIGESQPFRD
jgi:hypothetical protein